MQLWTVNLNKPDWQDAPAAADVCAALTAGDLVAVPTETVYGLAADATNGVSCAKIFKAKGRPQFNPLISHIPSLEEACLHGRFDALALRLAEAFWPGPLTLVVPKNESSPISDMATAGLMTVALRIPAGPVMRFLAERTGRPLAAPSANLSGKISPTRAQDVIDDLGEALSFVVDAGPCRVGIESTIVGIVDGTPRLLRPGGISREEIEDVLRTSLLAAAPGMRPDAPAAPGMLASHYAPNASMILNAQEVTRDDALLSFGSERIQGAERARMEFNLSPNGDLAEAAANLFRGMRTLDASMAGTIRVQFIPSFGLGEAINDRLKRAAAPRP